MPPILTHRASGVHGAAASLSPALAPTPALRAAQAEAEPPSWAQGPEPVASSGGARLGGLGEAKRLIGSAQGRAALAAMAAAGSGRPSAERIAELIDQLPTYLMQGGSPGRTLTDPALWADQLEAAQAQGAGTDAHAPFFGENTTALVFIMMLIAQQETTEEKRDAIRQLRMYSGMLDALNKLVTRELMPAMQEANRLVAKERDGSRIDRIEVLLAFPKDIDTHWATMDDKTGEVALHMDLGDAPQRRETVQGITQLMTLADQWRTSIQNQQTQQSSRFQAQDNASSATLNVINGVLKISHEGASNAIRNLSG